MKAYRLMYPIKTMARVLGVARSGYYAWIGKPQSERKTRDEGLKMRIRAIHLKSRKTLSRRTLN